MMLVCYKITPSLLHPSVISCAVWLGMLTIYTPICNEYPLTWHIYSAILLWLFFLCVFSILGTYAYIGNPQKNQNVVINEKKLLRIIPFAVLALIIAAYALIYRGKQYCEDNIFEGIRMASISTMFGEQSLVPFPAWVSISMEISNALILPLCLLLLFYTKTSKKISIPLTAVFLCYALIRSSKTVLAQIVAAFLLIMWKKNIINKKNALIVLLFGGAFIMSTHFIRSGEDKSFDFLHFFESYFLAPIASMEEIMTQGYSIIEQYHGEFTFRAFGKFVRMHDPLLTGNSDPFNLHRWALRCPGVCNVYTSLFPFYVDFGFWGLIAGASFYGWIGGWLYKHMQQGNNTFMLIYANLFYIYIFQFFSDFGMTFFWTNIVIVICCILLTTPILNTKKLQTKQCETYASPR